MSKTFFCKIFPDFLKAVNSLKFDLSRHRPSRGEVEYTYIPFVSGGDTSGRAMAFHLGRPGLNPWMDLGFFQFRIAVNLFSLGVKKKKKIQKLPG